MLSKPERPARTTTGPFRLGDFTAEVSAGSRHSRISVLLPEPLTPVTATNRPSGNRTVKFLRLFLSAPANSSHAPVFDETGRRWPRVGNFLCARKHFPVID